MPPEIEPPTDKEPLRPIKKQDPPDEDILLEKDILDIGREINTGLDVGLGLYEKKDKGI